MDQAHDQVTDCPLAIRAIVCTPTILVGWLRILCRHFSVEPTKDFGMYKLTKAMKSGNKAAAWLNLALTFGIST